MSAASRSNSEGLFRDGRQGHRGTGRLGWVTSALEVGRGDLGEGGVGGLRGGVAFCPKSQLWCKSGKRVTLTGVLQAERCFHLSVSFIGFNKKPNINTHPTHTLIHPLPIEHKNRVRCQCLRQPISGGRELVTQEGELPDQSHINS